ncbi:retrovirus-related pol polyprotein from transposon TNT 1-94 [Tanacetum coccineum]
MNIVVNSLLDINTSMNMNSSAAMNDSVNYMEMCNKCFELEAEHIKQHNMVEKYEYNRLSKSFPKLEQHCISLELAMQLNKEIFQKNNTSVNQTEPSFDQLFELNNLKAKLQQKTQQSRNTCPNALTPSDKKVVVTPMNNVKKVRLSRLYSGTVRFGNDHIARIIGYGDYQLGNVIISKLAKDSLVRGIPRLKFQKDHLCSACALGKSKKTSHQPKVEDTNQEKLYLLHMDLCGLMRVASINEKSSHSSAKQCCRRRNQTLVEAARTMLIFSKALLFLWAEAINTACYTQNRSLIRVQYNKTQYELMQDKKSDLSFFHVFGSLCYPTNEHEDLGKFYAKADIGIFVGYALAKKAFGIYNRRTRIITETIHVTFDELTTMASEQFSSGPGLHYMTPTTSST